jgi:hypothetical protein
LENYKRKIAIELERRRRERQGQLMAGMRKLFFIERFNTYVFQRPDKGER